MKKEQQVKENLNADLIAGQLLTEQEAADYLKVHKETLRRLRKSDKIKPLKLGERQIRYTIAMLEHYKLKCN